MYCVNVLIVLQVKAVVVLQIAPSLQKKEVQPKEISVGIHSAPSWKKTDEVL